MCIPGNQNETGSDEAHALPYALTSSAPDHAVNNKTCSGRHKARRKLWEIPSRLHCPVIGTCLDAGELRRIARKARMQSSDGLSDHDVHVSFVSAADAKNPLSVATQKTLERKYTTQIKRFARAKTIGQLTQLWEGAMERGEVPAALWATLTHPACDNALKARAFEEIHMLSHQIGAGQRADLKRLAAVENEYATLRHDFESIQRRSRRQLEAREQQLMEVESKLRAANQQNRDLAAIETTLRHELAEWRSRNSARHLESLESELSACRRSIAEARQENRRLNTALASAEKKTVQIQSERDRLSAECDAMERFVTQALSTCDTCDRHACDGQPDLGGRRILCVGGRNRLIEHYREMVTRCNGRFEHYDGGVEDNRQRLDSLLSSADAVVCATDSVSHDAYYRLKRFCKRHAKPHVFVRGSGISSFTRALYSMTG